MFETKPISCSTEARKCRCSILFLFNLHDLFLLKLEKIEDSLSDDSLIVFDWCLGAEITSLFRDDFVAIIQVSGFCQVPEVTGLAKMSILCPITRSQFCNLLMILLNILQIYQQNDIALNEINLLLAFICNAYQISNLDRIL